jgi:hypothetical protein
MRNALLSILAVGLLTFVSATPIQAQLQPNPTINEIILQNEQSATQSATDSAEATLSGQLASPSAQVEQRIQERKERDITEPNPVQKGRLAAFLDQNPPGPLSWNNFLQHAIRYAVTEGVQPNVIVLVLLFPLIASLIAASRHMIGLRGFGIYIPAVLSVALVSTGIAEGLIIFIAIVLTALITKRLLRKTKLSYLPRTALLLWTVSLGILATLILAPVLNLVTLMSVNIFPMLILVLLAENFLDAQARMKQSEAIALTVETISLAFICGLILKSDGMQKFALVEPEMLILGTALLNIIIGKFIGLRLTEWLRFRSIIEEEE